MKKCRELLMGQNIQTTRQAKTVGDVPGELEKDTIEKTDYRNSLQNPTLAARLNMPLFALDSIFSTTRECITIFYKFEVHKNVA